MTFHSSNSELQFQTIAMATFLAIVTKPAGQHAVGSPANNSKQVNVNSANKKWQQRWHYFWMCKCQRMWVPTWPFVLAAAGSATAAFPSTATPPLDTWDPILFYCA